MKRYGITIRRGHEFEPATIGVNWQEDANGQWVLYKDVKDIIEEDEKFRALSTRGRRWGKSEMQEALQRHMCECVDACAGIKNPSVVKDVVDAARTVVSHAVYCDEVITMESKCFMVLQAKLEALDKEPDAEPQ